MVPPWFGLVWFASHEVKQHLYFRPTNHLNTPTSDESCAVATRERAPNQIHHHNHRLNGQNKWWNYKIDKSQGKNIRWRRFSMIFVARVSFTQQQHLHHRQRRRRRLHYLQFGLSLPTSWPRGPLRRAGFCRCRPRAGRRRSGSEPSPLVRERPR